MRRLAPGSGGSLVLSGPAGIGKTTLLQFAAEKATGCQVLWATGSPVETGLPYAALSQLVAPIVDLLPALRPVQAAAVQAALALSAPVEPAIGPDAFPVYSGTLSLLSAASAARPVLALVDDCQWLDNESLKALLFAQRRLAHDAVGIILAARSESDLAPLWTGLPVIDLAGLDPSAAAALIAQRGMTLTSDVLEWLVRSTGGNPLALLDVPAYLPTAELALRALRDESAPVGLVLRAAYGRSVETMSAAERQALVIATMLDGSEIPVVAAALAFAELSLPALQVAEDAGLLTLGTSVMRVRHPLVRSAVIDAASAGARRAAHLACAHGLRTSSLPSDAEALVWHLADAALGPDETVAELLEQLGTLATARTGDAAACLTYRRAADLSETAENRARRLLAAARSGLAAGLPAESRKLLDELDSRPIETDLQRAQMEHVRGRLQAAGGDPPGAADVLFREASRIVGTDPGLAVQMAVDSAFSAVLAGEMHRAAAAGQLIASIQNDPATEALADLIVGTAMAMSGAGDDARALLDRCRPVFEHPDPGSELLQLAVYLATAYVLVNRFDEALPLLHRAIGVARERGALGVLPFALAMSATTAYRIGDWDHGYALACEAVSLAEDTAQAHVRPNALVMKAHIDAARGLERARADALSVIGDSAAMGASFIEAQGWSALGLLELSRGDPAAAIEPLRRCGALSERFGVFELGHLQWAAELVEAEMRCGTEKYTSATMQLIRQAVHPAATSFDHAVLARCEAMVASDASWEAAFERSVQLHDGSNLRPFELARTQLCFGERLRRHRRRRDARAHLSEAWTTFNNLGAGGWAQRAAHEISALGGRAPRPVSHVSDLLTPQELQVAVVVAGGATNREAAGSLFLSQKTVEFHLSNIYRRLGLRSRGELAAVLKERARQAQPGPTVIGGGLEGG